MSTEIDELKQARYRSDKTISGHNAFLRPPTGETNSVDTRGFYFVLKEPHPNLFQVPTYPRDVPSKHYHQPGAFRFRRPVWFCPRMWLFAANTRYRDIRD